MSLLNSISSAAIALFGFYQQNFYHKLRADVSLNRISYERMMEGKYLPSIDFAVLNGGNFPLLIRSVNIYKPLDSDSNCKQPAPLTWQTFISEGKESKAGAYAVKSGEVSIVHISFSPILIKEIANTEIAQCLEIEYTDINGNEEPWRKPITPAWLAYPQGGDTIALVGELSG